MALLPALLLLLLAVASRGVARMGVGAVAVGWWLGAGSGASDEPLRRSLDPERPVVVQASVPEGWRRAESGWQAWLEVEAVHQGEVVVEGVPRLRAYLASAEDPPYGRSVELKGYLRPPRPFLNGPPPRRPGPWALSVSSRRLARVVEADRWPALSRRIRALRAEVDQRLDRRAAQGGALARGLLLGDASRLELRRLIALRRLGLGHLVAVSGLHLGLLVGLAWLATSWTGPRARLATAALAVVVYLTLVGYRPSLVRAALMAGCALLSLAWERRPDALNAWAVAAGSMVALRPALVDDLGFQLTVAATLGLVTLAPALARRWSAPAGEVDPDPMAPAARAGGPLARAPLARVLMARALAASAAAHLATLPWSIGVFHLWSPGAVALNLVAVPWTSLTLPLALFAVLAEPWGAVGDLAWSLVSAAARPYDWLAELPPGLPWSLAVSRPVAGVVALSLALSWALVRWRPAPALLLATVGAAWLLPSPLPSDAGAELRVLDVGQGEAILLRDGDLSALIDGGGWRTGGIGQRVLLPALLEAGIHRLDAVVLTHPDLDHCAGLVEIAALVPVERLWSATGWSEPCYRELVALPGPTLAPLWRGRRMELGGWRLRVLHPAAGGERSGNESSLVLSVTHRAPPARTRVSRAERTPPAEVARTVLLTGDIGSATEARLPAAEIAAAALKIGHHGSRYSSDGAFLDRVAPRLALISAGEGNAYGHPAADVLERLAERGVAVWRTDRGGQIRLRFGEVVEVDQPWAREPTSSPPIELPYNAAQAARGCRSSPSWVPPPAARPPWPCGWPSRWISRW